MSGRNSVDLATVVEALEKLGIGFEMIGPPRTITKVGSLLHKEPAALYYYTGDDPELIATLQDSVLMCRAEVARSTANCSSIAVQGDPQLAFYRLCAHLFTEHPRPGIHPTAIIHEEARIAPDVHIGAYAVIGRSTIGAGSIIHAHVVVLEGCTIGERVVIEPHCCIGASGAVWVWGDDDTRVVLPQLGGVSIGDDSFLSADVAVVRGSLNEDTTIGKGCMIAPGSKLGHSVVLEERVHLANNVSIAGSARIGARSFLGSGSSVRSHARLAPDTIVGVGAAVVRDVLEPGTTVAGVPAVEMKAKEQPKGVPRPRRS